MVFCLFLIGYDFVSFSHRAAQLATPQFNSSTPHAVIALTGGSNRIAFAAEIAKDQNLPLFISGVNQEAKPDEVAIAAGVDTAFFECCTTLGYKARTTYENGLEVAQWSTKSGYSKLIIVTSNYHMERALLELERAMPDVTLTGLAVASPAIKAHAWWTDMRSAKRMGIEWIKWRIIKTQRLFQTG